MEKRVKLKKIMNTIAWIWLILVIIYVWVLGNMYCLIATCLSNACKYSFLDRCCWCQNALGFILGTIVYGFPSWILFLIAKKIKLKKK
jgi:hypothetical protein